MANFEPIVEWLLYQEDDHKQPGKIVDLEDGAGLTRLGVTQKNYGNVVPANFFTDMPFSTAVLVAKHVYQNDHWHHLNGERIAHDEIAAPLLSFAVNTNTVVATKHLQRVLGLNDDGILGLGTLTVLNQKDPVATALMFRANWENYYRDLVGMKPSDERFLDEWLSRAKFPYPSPLVGSKYA